MYDQLGQQGMQYDDTASSSNMGDKHMRGEANMPNREAPPHEQRTSSVFGEAASKRPKSKCPHHRHNIETTHNEHKPNIQQADIADKRLIRHQLTVTNTHTTHQQ